MKAHTSLKDGGLEALGMVLSHKEKSCCTMKSVGFPLRNSATFIQFFGHELDKKMKTELAWLSMRTGSRGRLNRKGKGFLTARWSGGNILNVAST